MDSLRNDASYKNRNNSGEIKENKTSTQKLSDNLPTYKIYIYK